MNRMKARARCRLCEAGFRRVAGVHVGSQRLGMIPETVCIRVFAVRDEGPAYLRRRWLAHVDGAPLCRLDRVVRRFATEHAAIAAALAGAPRRWHA